MQYINGAYYSEILSDKEIFFVGKLIEKFENGEINYLKLKMLLNEGNIELTPILINEKKNLNIYPEDIDAYLLSNSYYHNVLVKYDEYMMDLLKEIGGNEKKI